MKRFLRGLSHYLLFFMLAAFVVTCCISLFTTALMQSLEVEPTAEMLNTAAKLTFANVLLLSLLFALIDFLRRRLTVERTAKHIAAATKQIVSGDFSARVAPTGRLLTDDSFNEIVDCFNQMAGELSSVETLRTDFISNVSHEMKTPLAVIQNYGRLLQAASLSDARRMEYARGVAEGARRLSDMMSNILKLSKLENQQIFPHAEKYNLGEQLCEALLQFESIWERQQIEIETDIAEDIIVCADQELLFLVWNNLLSNAFKFTPAGGRVSLSLTATPEQASVTVRDSGCGMSAETGAHIFEKFYQGDGSRATQGNGLGLALVKRVVDILHAEISVESVLGEGSAFTVRLRRTA